MIWFQMLIGWRRALVRRIGFCAASLRCRVALTKRARDVRRINQAALAAPPPQPAKHFARQSIVRRELVIGSKSLAERGASKPPPPNFGGRPTKIVQINARFGRRMEAARKSWRKYQQ